VIDDKLEVEFSRDMVKAVIRVTMY